MTEDQKASSLVLELLHAGKLPRALPWISTEVRMAGFRAEVASILDLLERAGLVMSEVDALGIRRWEITMDGKEALDGL